MSLHRTAVLLVSIVSPCLAEDLPRARPEGRLEVVATIAAPMPTGVAVAHSGRVFVNFPRWGDPVEFTVAELVNGRPRAYPDPEINRFDPARAAETFVSVQSVVVDAQDRLWVLDTGSPEFKPPIPGGPKLVCIDLAADRVLRTIAIPPDVALATTYLNDVRFDLQRGPGGTAFITDSSLSGPNAIIVVDLATGASVRRLHDHASTRAEPGFVALVEGRPLPGVAVGADGIALPPGGERLFYCPLSSRRLYSVALAALADRTQSDAEVAATVTDHGDRGFASDGLEADSQGRVYLTNYEDNAILRRNPDGGYETLVYDDRVLWPDTLALAADGSLYFTANQLHRQARFQAGREARQPPYVVFRLRLGP